MTTRLLALLTLDKSIGHSAETQPVLFGHSAETQPFLSVCVRVWVVCVVFVICSVLLQKHNKQSKAPLTLRSSSGTKAKHYWLSITAPPRLNHSRPHGFRQHTVPPRL